MTLVPAIALAVSLGLLVLTVLVHLRPHHARGSAARRRVPAPRHSPD